MCRESEEAFVEFATASTPWLLTTAWMLTADTHAAEDLVRALQTLGARERECVVLRHYLDLTEKQTAEALGVSVGSVKGYTSRGLAALRVLMKEDDHV